MRNLTKVRQFKVVLMNVNGIRVHIVNCTCMDSAKFICEGIFPNMRVIEVYVIN